MVTEIKSIDGYTINTTPQTVAVEYKDQTVTVQYESTTIENTRQKADVDRKSTRLNSSHIEESRMPSSA